ncbi:MAG: YjfB family protein [Burkholderiaceae bacterium]|nr:YjfB family protein [Burkholderiaceae bacterium]MBP7661349.1 YjfB family protein [Burkholderiaceae bacterium]
MDSLSASTVGNASAATPGTVSGTASVLMLRKALDLQASSAAQLIESLPRPALASSGTLGTRLNTYA